MFMEIQIVRISEAEESKDVIIGGGGDPFMDTKP